MNEIKITLSIPGLPEAINNLAEALRGGNVSSVPTGSAPEVKNASAASETPVAPAQPNTKDVSATPTENVTAPTATATTATATTVNYTIDQLSVAGAALCEQGKMAQLIALLGKYGVQAVTQLKPTPDVLNPFASELKALGANL